MSNQKPTATDFVYKSKGIGELSSVQTNVFWGHNHETTGTGIRPNNDNMGYLFFTKPECNLTYDNIINAPEISALVKEGTENSQLGAIRAYLDPTNNKFGVEGVSPPLLAGMVDADSVFIPLLSNTCLNLSGWPDISVETYTTEQGIYGEVHSFGDGGSGIYGTYDLTGTFQNIAGDPITALFFNWCVYINRVGEGSIHPYPDKIVEDEIDYMTRIYRVVLNESKTHVTKIACTGAAFPIGSSIGAAYAYDSTKAFSEENSQIPVTFRCVGAFYETPQIIDAFNDAVAKWQPLMKENSQGIIVGMRRLSLQEAQMHNSRGYPRIEHDRSIHWYVTHEEYTEFLNYYGIDPSGERQAAPVIQHPISPDVAAVEPSIAKLARTQKYTV